jgi:uncharacterized protein (DUF362 family)
VAAEAAPAGTPQVIVARGGSVSARLEAVLRPLGGIGRFVRPGAIVAVKPNGAFAEPPATGGNTTPEIVGAIVRACREAGAARVVVTDHCLSSHGTFGTENDVSGVTQAAKAAGAEVFDTGAQEQLYLPADLDAPGIRSHPVNAYVLQADVVINAPRLKTHPEAGYTMGIKNLMGTMLRPDMLHARLAMGLACLGQALRPHVALTIVDATDIVRGWAAGQPGKLTPLGALIAGRSMVSVDAIGVTLFGADPLARWPCSAGDSYLRIAHEQGWGVADPRLIQRVDIDV